MNRSLPNASAITVPLSALDHQVLQEHRPGMSRRVSGDRVPQVPIPAQVLALVVDVDSGSPLSDRIVGVGLQAEVLNGAQVQEEVPVQMEAGASEEPELCPSGAEILRR